MSDPISIIVTEAIPAITIGNTFDQGRTFTISPFVTGISNAGIQIKDETAGVVIATYDPVNFWKFFGNVSIVGDLNVSGNFICPNFFPPEG